MMTESTTTQRAGRPLRRRAVAVAVGVTAMLTPLVAAPAAPAYSGLGGLVDEMLITGAGGPGGGKVDGIGSLGSAVLDGVSNLLKPNVASTTRAKARIKARVRARSH
jgi:hypothetical protein